MAVGEPPNPQLLEERRRLFSLRPASVLVIGGGTGLSTLLRGLKRYVLVPNTPPMAASNGRVISKLSAVVTVTDDGGSSGRLRKDFGMLPPGDIRNCLVALAEDEGLLSKLFQYRFPKGSGLEGHNFGNLLLTAMTALVGDFAEAVHESSLILASRGHIFPSTVQNVHLEALMDDGSVVEGETNITASDHRIKRLKMVPENPQPLDQTLRAIEEADLITVGPGSLFTSLIPNVLVSGIPEAIARSRAKKVFVCNLMMQPNESLDLTASQHIKAIREHAGQKIFDYALVNNAPISRELAAKYAEQGTGPVQCDTAAIEALGIKCIEDDFVEEGDVARHNTRRVAERLLELI
jgi:uncharacterized cofD-like protein